jgi:hypothetical protein
MVLNATFNNISAISCLAVSLKDEILVDKVCLIV